MPDWSGPGVEHYTIGAIDAPTTGVVSPGIALMGGGDWPIAAFAWFVRQAGGGHIVVLRAHGGAELQDEIFREVGGMLSVETLVIHADDAAQDSRVIASLAHADGIFLGGGDQSNYVRLWKHTRINEVLDAHVRAGRPIGGTSAGLAVLGGYSYGCLDSISMVSSVALENPTAAGVTLVRDFLHLPYLQSVITDSHFANRARQGRLIAFVGRLAQEENDPRITGLGIDEDTAIVIDGQGIGRFFNRGSGHAWLIRPMKKPETIIAGRPLEYREFPIIGIGPDSILDLRTFKVAKPAFIARAEVRHGHLLLGGVPEPPRPEAGD